MKYTATLLFTLVFTITACAPNSDSSVSSNPSYPNSPNPDPSAQNEYAPQPSDSSLTRDNAFLDSKELLTLESFPLQFTLHLAGSLPTPCNQIRVAVNIPDAENNLFVDVYSVSNPDRICAQVIAPFDVSIPLGSFPPGKYLLWVNGEMIVEFQS